MSDAYFLCKLDEESVDGFLAVLLHGGGVEKVVRLDLSSALAALLESLGEDERTKDRPKTYNPSKVEFQGSGDQLPFQLPVEGYVYNDGQRFGSQIHLRGSLVDADMSKRIGMNTRLTWVGRPWVVSSLPHYDANHDLITLTIHLLD